MNESEFALLKLPSRNKEDAFHIVSISLLAEFQKPAALHHSSCVIISQGIVLKAA
jgi:hypothetical protein